MYTMGSFVNSLLSTIFIIFSIAAVGYLLGAIEIKGISLGSAGVLLAALLFGVFACYVPSFTLAGREIVLFDGEIKTKFSLVSNIGTALFVSSVGLTAGPKFFRSFNKASVAYVGMGVLMIVIGAAVTVLLVCLDKSLSAEMAVGLMTGALTSTPALSAAKETAGDAADLVTAGYGIAYLFGVLGVVFFVQLMPRILKIDIPEERERFTAANAVAERTVERRLKKLEPYGFFPFFLSIALGCVIGSVKLSGDFSLGNSGGCLLSGLIVGHFGHMGGIDLKIEKSTLNFFREMGLVLFLIGAGVPGGVSFMANIRAAYFIYGALITLIPMIGGYFLGRYVFKLDIFNNLGSITGGMTSTPALASLIATIGTDEVSAACAATYPVALVCVVIAAKLIIMVG